jgi:3-hydroxybutyryl-CoA dehydrogenase
MNILVLATPEQEAEFGLRFYNRAYLHLQNPEELALWLPQADLVFDLLLHEQPWRIEQYKKEGKADKLLVFCNASGFELEALAADYLPLNFHLVGLHPSSTSFEREVLEVSILQESSRRAVDKACVFLATLYEIK